MSLVPYSNALTTTQANMLDKLKQDIFQYFSTQEFNRQYDAWRAEEAAKDKGVFKRGIDDYTAHAAKKFIQAGATNPMTASLGIPIALTAGQALKHREEFGKWMSTPNPTLERIFESDRKRIKMAPRPKYKRPTYVKNTPPRKRKPITGISPAKKRIRMIGDIDLRDNRVVQTRYRGRKRHYKYWKKGMLKYL